MQTDEQGRSIIFVCRMRLSIMGSKGLQSQRYNELDAAKSGAHTPLWHFAFGFTNVSSAADHTVAYYSCKVMLFRSLICY